MFYSSYNSLLLIIPWLCINSRSRISWITHFTALFFLFFKLGQFQVENISNAICWAYTKRSAFCCRAPLPLLLLCCCVHLWGRQVAWRVKQRRHVCDGFTLQPGFFSLKVFCSLCLPWLYILRDHYRNQSYNIVHSLRLCLCLWQKLLWISFWFSRKTLTPLLTFHVFDVAVQCFTRGLTAEWDERGNAFPTAISDAD